MISISIFSLLSIISAIAVGGAFVCEIRRDLMMFQQNSYRPERYHKWLSDSGDTTSGWRLFGLIVILATFTPFCSEMSTSILILLFGLTSWISLARRKYKKPLVMTKRAWRILVTALVIVIALCAGVVVVYGCANYDFVALAQTLLACYCASHIVLLVSNFILTPIEKSINRKFYNKARKTLEAMPQLKIIGITGSYGKTTTKHYLTRILSEEFETLMTPGSYNTTLGVVRTINEMLKPYHEVFVVEMGAKNIGDIKEICDLVHPSAGIITAVGPQHLENFGTIANVQRTKFELADSLPAQGLALVNNDFPESASRDVENVRCLRYAIRNTEKADYIARDIVYSPEGTTFVVVNNTTGKELSLTTRLVGECNISNILAGVVVALEMGMSEAKIAYAVGRLEQVEHRMSIKRGGGITIIDDAFNSNPVGSAMALDVLGSMTSGKRILITPGMIELGSEQETLNFEFGKKAAKCCDIALVVGKYNRKAISSGLEDGGMPKANIRCVDTFAQAQTVLHSIQAVGDIVLYENDLPDTFK